MRKLNLSRYPNIENTITYFQSQYDASDEEKDYQDEDVDQSLNYFQNQLDEYQKLNLNDDVLYELLLKADVKTLPSLCHLNKKTHSICESKEFWHHKASYPFFIDNGNLQNKIQEYILLEKAEDNVFNLMQDIANLLNKKKVTEDYYKNMLINISSDLLNNHAYFNKKLQALLAWDNIPLKEFKQKIMLLWIEFFYINDQDQLNRISQYLLKNLALELDQY